MDEGGKRKEGRNSKKKEGRTKKGRILPHWIKMNKAEKVFMPLCAFFSINES